VGKTHEGGGAAVNSVLPLHPGSFAASKIGYHSTPVLSKRVRKYESRPFYDQNTHRPFNPISSSVGLGVGSDKPR